jgi:hypothetical protein
MAGLLAPALVVRPAWLVAGAIVGAFFVGVLGPERYETADRRELHETFD